MQLSTVYQGKNKSVQFTVDPYYLISAGAKLSIFDGNGSLSVRGTDVFDTVLINFSSDEPFLQKGFYSLELSTIYVGFTYNFGKSKYKTRQRREREKKRNPK